MRGNEMLIRHSRSVRFPQSATGERVCRSCGKVLPESTSRRKFCDGNCRRAHHRRTVGAFQKPATPTLSCKTPDVWAREATILTLAAWEPNSLIEIWTEQHGRGVLDLHRYLSDNFCRQGASVRCQFPKHSHFLHWDDVWLIAIHNGVPRWLSWVHPKPEAPTKKRTILLDITAGAIQPGNFAGEVRHDIDSTDQEQDRSSDRLEDR